MFEPLDDYMINYYPFHGGENPKHDEDSATIVFIKANKVNSHRKENFYSRVLTWLKKFIQREELKDKTIVLTVVPGHSPDSSPGFMHEIVGQLLKARVHPNLKDGCSQLKRIELAKKMATSQGPRGEEAAQMHRDTIAVSGEG